MNRYLHCRTAFSSLLAVSAWFLVASPSSAGLVGYWPLDGNANDLSPSGVNGTLEGEIAYSDDVPAALGDGQSVLLNPEQCAVACSACVADVGELGITASVIAVGPVHTHLLARFGSNRIRPTVGRLKSMMTRAVKEHDPGFQPKRTWSKGCHPRSCVDERDYRTKFRYVERHRNDGGRCARLAEYHHDIR